MDIHKCLLRSYYHWSVCHLLAITFCWVTWAGRVKRSLNTAVVTMMVAHQGNPDTKHITMHYRINVDLTPPAVSWTWARVSSRWCTMGRLMSLVYMASSVDTPRVPPWHPGGRCGDSRGGGWRWWRTGDWRRLICRTETRVVNLLMMKFETLNLLVIFLVL